MRPPGRGNPDRTCRTRLGFSPAVSRHAAGNRSRSTRPSPFAAWAWTPASRRRGGDGRYRAGRSVPTIRPARPIRCRGTRGSAVSNVSRPLEDGESNARACGAAGRLRRRRHRARICESASAGAPHLSIIVIICISSSATMRFVKRPIEPGIGGRTQARGGFASRYTRPQP